MLKVIETDEEFEEALLCKALYLRRIDGRPPSPATVDDEDEAVQRWRWGASLLAARGGWNRGDFFVYIED